MYEHVNFSRSTRARSAKIMAKHICGSNLHKCKIWSAYAVLILRTFNHFSLNIIKSVGKMWQENRLPCMSLCLTWTPSVYFRIGFVTYANMHFVLSIGITEKEAWASAKFSENPLNKQNTIARVMNWFVERTNIFPHTSWSQSMRTRFFVCSVKNDGCMHKATASHLVKPTIMKHRFSFFVVFFFFFFLFETKNRDFNQHQHEAGWLPCCIHSSMMRRRGRRQGRRWRRRRRKQWIAHTSQQTNGTPQYHLHFVVFILI